jgi:hypothetical protein
MEQYNMDAIVPPGNQNLIIDDNNRYKSTHYCHDDSDTLNRISTSAENIMNNDNSNSHHQSATAERLGLAGIGAVERNGSEGRGNTDRNGLEGRLLVREEGHEIRDGIRHLDSSIERFGLKNLDATKDGFKDLCISMKDDLKDVIISHKEDMKDLLISQKNDFKEVLLKNCQVEKDMLLQFKDAQLVAMQNKSDLSAQIAECCCENKELVREEATKTRELVLKLDENNLRDKLRKAEEEITALKIRSTIPPLPVAAISI